MQALYSLEEFAKTYTLDAATAQRLFRITGPAKADIDVFMAVYRRKHPVDSILTDINPAPPVP